MKREKLSIAVLIKLHWLTKRCSAGAGNFKKRWFTMNPYENQNYSNLLNAIALLIGIENLFENRQQSAYNDVHAANDAQKQELLQEIKPRLDAVEAKLDMVIELLGGEDGRKAD